jgi:hypothetical protein
MIYKLDHIGITVPSLLEAQEQIEAIHPCFHTELGMEAREALREVSVHQPEQLQISLHRRPSSISIELIEYPRIAETRASIFPWSYCLTGPPSQLAAVKAAARLQIERGREAGRFANIVSQLAAHNDFNALILTVENLEEDEQFWKALRCHRIHSDDELVVLGLTSLLPPKENTYILLFRVDSARLCHTDAEGINEIAFLCDSCSTSLDTCRQGGFRSSVSTYSVDGKEINLGYLRSPSGALAELYSVRIRSHER